MKQIFKLSILLLLTLNFGLLTVQAQTPMQFKYQAVLRDASGTIISNETKDVEIDILKSSITGTSVFNETHNVTTTTQGLININIGLLNDMSGINWDSDTYFIKITIDGTEMGVSQLLSVPYAMHARTVEIDQVDDADADATNEIQDLSLTGNTLSLSDDATTVNLSNYLDDQTVSISGGTGITTTGTYPNFTVTNTSPDRTVSITAGNDIEVSGTYPNFTVAQTSKHYIGELFGGGIIFWLNQEGDHGLIASLTDLDNGNGVAWSATTNQSIGSAYRSYYNGFSNTGAMYDFDYTAGYAGALCYTYRAGGFYDWYLPSHRELVLLFSQDVLINKTIGVADLHGEYSLPTKGRYWSSTELDASNAWCFKPTNNASEAVGKIKTYRVRAIRGF